MPQVLAKLDPLPFVVGPPRCRKDPGYVSYRISLHFGRGATGGMGDVLLLQALHLAAGEEGPAAGPFGVFPPPVPSKGFESLGLTPLNTKEGKVSEQRLDFQTLGKGGSVHFSDGGI